MGSRHRNWRSSNAFRRAPAAGASQLAARMAASGVKNLAQVYTQLKYTKDENTAISAELLATLASQGFLDSPR